jgi:hypothetical protein
MGASIVVDAGMPPIENVPPVGVRQRENMRVARVIARTMEPS